MEPYYIKTLALMHLIFQVTVQSYFIHSIVDTRSHLLIMQKASIIAS